MIEQKTLGSRAFTLVNTLLLVLLSLFFLYPMWYVLVGSISDPFSLFVSNDLLLLPKGFSLKGYEQVFKNPNILTGYKNTLWYLSVGTVCNVLATSLGAYVLSRPNLMLKKFFSLSVVFTMYFGGGLIPTYLLMRDLKIINTVWVMVLPGLISTYNMIIVRTFIQNNIPREILESSQIDGCSDFQYFLRMVLPLSKAVIAVITLYYAVGHWNAYFNALIYLTDREKYPLQIILREILVSNQVNFAEVQGIDPEQIAAQNSLANQLKYSLIIVSCGPILLVYPFVQKYFVKGLTIGAVKG